MEKRQGNGRMAEVKLAVDNARVLKRNHTCEKAVRSTSDCSYSIEGASCALHLRSRFIVVCSHREQWRKGLGKRIKTIETALSDPPFGFPHRLTDFSSLHCPPGQSDTRFTREEKMDAHGLTTEGCSRPSYKIARRLSKLSRMTRMASPSSSK